MLTVKSIVNHKAFTSTVITFILLNAIIIGIETYPTIYEKHKGLFHILEMFFLWAFTIEIALRLIASKPTTDFFKSGWNLFDFIIVASGHLLAGGYVISILRILRVLRVLRTVTVIPSLQKLVAALFRTIPAIGNIMILMGILFYIYAVIGTVLYRTLAPELFGSLQASLLTLFQIVTLDSWSSGIMRPLLTEVPLAWLYFVSFVLIGTFIIINLFVGVIVNNVQEVAVITEKKDNESDLDITPTLANQVTDLRKEILELKQLITSLQKDRS